jgi:hypothetical protein
MQLIPTPIAPDLQAAANEIQTIVQSGQAVGLGVVVVLRGGHYFVDAFGSMVRNPGPSKGFVLDLIDCLAEIGRKRKAAQTTFYGAACD